MADKNIFTSSTYDGKTCLQLQIEMREDGFAKDGSYSNVIADYYLVSVAKPSGITGNVTSDYGTGQTFTCSIGSTSKTFSSNAFIIADAINKAGDKLKIGSLNTTVKRSGETGSGNIKVSFNCTFTWRSGYPSRSISGTYSCINTKHIVTYNANGGKDAPSQQIKCYGHILDLRNDIPTRNGYIFKGWSTRRNGDVEYKSGGKYGLDEDVTLYAIWKMVDVKIDLTPVDIKIPCDFHGGIGGFNYFYCDDNYYIDIPYSYSFPDEITNAYVGVGNSGYTEIFSDTGTVRVTMKEIGDAIYSYGKQNEVLLNMKFSFLINNDEVEIPVSVLCPLIDFNFTNISVHHSYTDRNANNLLYITFVCTYPKSFNPSVKQINSYPLITYESGTSLKALTCVGRKEIGDNAFLFTYNLNTNGLVSPLKIRCLDKIFVYNELFDSNDTLSRNLFLKDLSLHYSSINKNIVIYKNKTVEAREFVETDYLNGFYKGGIFCMNQFIETNDLNENASAIITSNLKAKEFIELRNEDPIPVGSNVYILDNKNVSTLDKTKVSDVENMT